MSPALPSHQIAYEIASPEDDAQLRRVLRETPMQGSIELTLEREPSFHKAAAVEGDSAVSILGRETPSGRVIGFGSRAIQTATVNAKPTRLGYLSQLRLEPRYQGRPKLVAKGYAFYREHLHDPDIPLYVTTIFEENRVARRFLEADIVGMPTYRALDTLSTFVIPVRRRRTVSPPSGVEIRTGRASDLPDIATCLRDTARRFQFMPHWNAEDLESQARTPDLSPEDFVIATRGGRLLGCVAAWDQGGFKQTIVKRYRGALGTWRPILNQLGVVTGLPFLPPPGCALRHATVSHLGFTEEDPALLIALLCSAYNRCTERGLHALTLGLTQKHPAISHAKGAFRHLETRSRIYLVHYEDGTAAANAVDDRPAHLEIATL